MAAVCALGSCSRMMPLRAICSRSIEQLQLLRPASSAPSRWPRGRRRTRRCRAFAAGRASPASSRNRDSERTACPGSSWSDRRAAPFRPPQCPCRSRPRPRPASWYLMLGCDQVWCPTVWPWAAILRTSSGCAEADLPIRKKVARTHSRASAASTFGVVPGHGPSSKVSTTSRSSQRQGLRKALQADARRGSGIDGAERVRCRARPCAGIRRPVPRRSTASETQPSRRRRPRRTP